MDDRSAWSGRRVLVTGAAGFIARRLAVRLAQRGAEVVGFDRRRAFGSLWWNPRERRGPTGRTAGRGARLTRRVREEPPPGELAPVYFDRNATMSGAKRRGSAGMDRRSNAAWVSPQAVSPDAPIRFRRDELRDSVALREAAGGAEVIFHLAARNGHGESMVEPLADFEDNVMGTIAVLAAAAATAPGARLVFASTRQLYGAPGHLPAGEDHSIDPPDVHSVHKETAEHLLRRGAAERGVRLSILRLTNTYGPDQPTAGPSAGLTGRFLGDALAGREITILGDPELLRDFNHVDDVVDAFLRAGRPEAPSRTWNLGSSAVSLREFAAAIFRALGEEPRVRVAPLPAGFQAIAIGDFHSDWSAIRRDLGWEPEWSLDRGLAETVGAMRLGTS